MGRWIVGIDEAGRGPLAGPVTVAAVAFRKNSEFRVQGPGLLKDSKRLSPQKRRAIYYLLTTNPHISWAITSVSASTIDRIGITQALNRAVAAALRKLLPNPYSLNPVILLDGSLYAPSYFRQCTIIKGDECVELIAAASILAKVHRDRIMTRLHRKFPHYGFAMHKGYGTRSHYQALEEFGPCPLHRRTFLDSLAKFR